MDPQYQTKNCLWKANGDLQCTQTITEGYVNYCQPLKNVVIPISRGIFNCGDACTFYGYAKGCPYVASNPDSPCGQCSCDNK